MKIAWDQVGSRKFETGVDHGVLYFYDRRNATPVAVPWNGITQFSDTSKASEVEEYFIDGVKYLTRRRPSDYSGKLSAFTYPDEFDRFVGARRSDSGITFQDQEVSSYFNLSYRTRIGNDLYSTDAGYKLHLLYNLTATEDSKNMTTIGDTTEPEVFTWNITSKPEYFAAMRPTSHVIVDSTKVSVSVLAQIEAVIYGSDTTIPRLPTVAEFNAWG